MTNAEINASIRIAIAELSKVSNALGLNVSVKTYIPSASKSVTHEFTDVTASNYADCDVYHSFLIDPDNLDLGYKVSDCERYSTFDYFKLLDEEETSKKEEEDAS